MAVEETRLHSAGATGTATGTSPLRIKENYRSRYRVKTNSALDSPDVVLAYFRGNASLPWMGRIFRYGNGGSTGAICRSVTATYIENSEGWYEVDCGFEPLEGGEDEGGDQSEVGQDEEGKATEDPLKWRDEIDVGYTQISIPAESGIFRRFVGGAGDNLVLKPGTKRAVTNSAGVPFDPLPEYEVDIKIIRITRHVRDYPRMMFNNFQGATNSDGVTIQKPKYRFIENLRRYAARLKFNASFAIINRVKVWQQTTEIYVLPPPLTWRRELVDRGLDRRAMHGDPDGEGGVISTDSIDPGGAYHRKMVDAEGFPIVEPVLLDGKGQPLDPGKPPVFLEFSFYVERPFAGLVNDAW